MEQQPLLPDQPEQPQRQLLLNLSPEQQEVLLVHLRHAIARTVAITFDPSNPTSGVYESIFQKGYMEALNTLLQYDVELFKTQSQSQPQQE